MASRLAESWRQLRRAGELHVDRDLRLIADHHAARLECLVPGEAVGATVDLALCTEPCALVAPGVADAAFRGDVQNERTSDIADREIARQGEVATDVAIDPRADEAHRRKALDVEE